MEAQPAVEAYLGSLVRDRAQAEDLLQQVALTATEKFDDYDPQRSFTGWALGIARNKTLQYFESSKADRLRFGQDLVMQLAETHERLADEGQPRAQALDDCMAKLPEQSLALLKRRYIQNLKPGKIADMIGVSANSVRISLHRIRTALRQCIERRVKQLQGDA